MFSDEDTASSEIPERAHEDIDKDNADNLQHSESPPGSSRPDVSFELPPVSSTSMRFLEDADDSETQEKKKGIDISLYATTTRQIINNKKTN